MAWIPGLIATGVSLYSAIKNGSGGGGGQKSMDAAPNPGNIYAGSDNNPDYDKNGIADSFEGAVKPGMGGIGYYPNQPGVHYDPTSEKIGRLEDLGLTGLQSDTVKDARAQQDEMRNRYLGALDNMERIANGQDSVVAQQAKLEQARMQRAFQSQLATLSGQGYYSPAAVRMAMGQQSGMQQALSGQTAAAMAQERQAARDAYIRAIAAGRSQDQALMNAELAQEEARQRFFTAMEGAGQNWAQMDQQRMLALLAGRQQASETAADLKLRRDMAAAGLAEQARQYDANRSDAYLMGGMGAGSGLIQSYLQSQPSNQNGGTSTSNGLIDPWGKP